jgi:Tfp pilus assembly protein PilZ
VSERRDREDAVERRQAPRLTPNELTEPVLVVGSRLVNIGPGGLMLEAPVPLVPNSPLQLHLLVGGERTDLNARVRGCVPRGVGRRTAWGVGVQFETLDPVSRERLERALGLGPRTRGRA